MTAGRRLKQELIIKAPPFVAAAGAYYIGAPWYVAGLILVSAVYWHGPIVVYFTQRMPTRPSLNAVDDESSLPAAHRDLFHQTVPLLQGEGFRNIGRFGCTDERLHQQATVCLLQHPETSDLAHLIVATQDGRAGSAETLGFSRARIDGTRICTDRNTIPSPFPPPPRDSVLRVDGSFDLLDLWRIHQARVAADVNARRNEPVTDGLRFQMDLEREGTRKHLESGLWQQDELPQFLRPTARGALLMCLRMLPPWKQMARMRARVEAHRLLRESERLAQDAQVVRRVEQPDRGDAQGRRRSRDTRDVRKKTSNLT